MAGSSSDSREGREGGGRDPALTWAVPPPLDGADAWAAPAAAALAAAADAHLAALAAGALAAEGSPRPAAWAPVLARLAAAAAAALSPPALAAAGGDPRAAVRVRRAAAGGAAPADGAVVADAAGGGVAVELRGGPDAELVAAERALPALAFAAYWNRAEVAFLAAEAASLAAAAGVPAAGPGGLAGAAAVAARASAAAAAAAAPGGGAAPSPSPHLDHGLGLAGGAAPAVDAARLLRPALWASLACRSPGRGVLCEPPHVERLEPYAAGDLALRGFLAAAAPPRRRCAAPGCGAGAAAHLRTFAAGDALATLSAARLPPGAELPPGQVWAWARPLGAGAGALAAARRVALPPDAAAASFAHVLALALGARRLALAGGAAARGAARFLAAGATVLCLHVSHAPPLRVALPPARLALARAPQVAWLAAEAKELTEEADEAFDALEAALDAAAGAPAGAPGLGAPPPDAAAARATLREVRGAFMDALAEVVSGLEARLAAQARAEAEEEQGGDGRGSGAAHQQQRQHPGRPRPLPPAEAMEALSAEAVWELNRLRRQLSLAALQWAAAAGPPAAAAPRAAPARRAGGAAGGGGGGERPAPARAATPPLQTFGAPALAEPGDAEPAPPAAAGESVPISTGLVARYVARFEAPPALAGAGARGEPLEDEGDGDAGALQAAQRPSTSIDLECAPPGAADDVGRRGGRLEQLVAALRGLAPLRPRALAAAERAAKGAAAAAPAAAPAPPPPPPPLEAKPVVRSSPAKEGAAAAAGGGDEDVPASHFDEWHELLQSAASAAAGKGARAPPAAASPPPAPAPGAPRPRLAAAARLPGRPLLPHGADGACVTVFDGEPTSVVAYFLSSAPYRDYVRGATAAIVAAGGDPLLSAATADCQLSLEDGGGGGGGAPRARLRVTAYFAPQFAALRGRCVAGGEPAFLASLSRCRGWAPAGGKSGAWFCRSRDGRYVAKQLSLAERAALLEAAPAILAHVARALPPAEGGAAGAGGGGGGGAGGAGGSPAAPPPEPPPSCLAKMLGLFTVSVEPLDAAGGALPPAAPYAAGRDGGGLDLVVMEDVLYAARAPPAPPPPPPPRAPGSLGAGAAPPPLRVYDLKGCDRGPGGGAPPGGPPGPAAAPAVLLDADLRAAPLLVAPAARARLLAALWADTAALAALGVMDYSLLAAVDARRGVLTAGLIDYARRYSWDKQLESWVKRGARGDGAGAGGGGGGGAGGGAGGGGGGGGGAAGGAPAGALPTVVGPRQYARRLRAAAAAYFAAAPGAGPPPEDPDPDEGL